MSNHAVCKIIMLAGALVSGAFLPVANANEDPNAQLLKAGTGEPQATARDLKPPPTSPYGRPSHAPHALGRQPAVLLRPSAPVIPIGAPIGFEVKSSVDGFGHVYVLSASGRVQLWMENAPIVVGRQLQFPTGGLAIHAAAPAGVEEILFIITKTKIRGFMGYGTTHAPRVLSYDHYSFKQALEQMFVGVPRRDWGFARATVHVIDQPGWTSDWGAWGDDPPGYSISAWGWNAMSRQPDWTSRQ